VIKLVLPSAGNAEAVGAARSHLAPAGLARRDLDQARAMLLALPADHPARGVAERDAFYARPSAEALLFGQAESGFTLERAEALIAEAGLRLLGLQLDDAVLPDPARASRLETSPAIQLWAAKPTG
jgi:hypothetical protein